MNPVAVMRPGVSQCPTTAGAQCDFSGPKTAARVHQESFFTLGLGTTASGCPGSEYKSLPEGLFPPVDNERALKSQGCQRTDLLPLFTRQSPSWGPNPNIREMENVSNLIPGAWQTDYAGVNSLSALGSQEQTFVNSREQSRQAYIAQKQLEMDARSRGLPAPGRPMGQFQPVQRYGQGGSLCAYA